MDLGAPLLLFSSTDPNASARDFQAVIDWGDGTGSEPDAPIESLGLGRFAVGFPYGHSYESAGHFTISVRVARVGGDGQEVAATVPATITAGSVTTQPAEFGALEGQPTGEIVVATLTDDNSLHDLNRYPIGIDWGDGSRSAGRFRPAENGAVEVLGEHTYQAAGLFLTTVTWSTRTAWGRADVHEWDVQSRHREDDPDRTFRLPLGQAEVSLGTGQLLLRHPLDFDLSPGTGVGRDPALVYNPGTVAVRPIIELTFNDLGERHPTAIEVTLTWDDFPAQAPVTFPVDSPPAGATYRVAVPTAGTVTQTGVYPWQAHVRLEFGGAAFPVEADFSGRALVVVQDNPHRPTPLGLAGWGLAGVSRLVLSGCADDVILTDGTGAGRWFHGTFGGNYQSPAEDFGSLQKQADGTFVYTAKYRTQYRFNAQGLLTQVTDLHHLAVTYSYDPQGRLTGVATPDGGVTTVDYSAGQVVLTEPGDRRVTLTLDGAGRLTGLADADGQSTRAFTYDDQGHLTRDQWDPLDTSFGYDPDSGLLRTVDRGLGTVVTITAAAAQGLAETSDQDASARPDGATVADPVHPVTTYTLDDRGRELRADRPLGVTERWQRDAAGEVTAHIDPLHRRTAYSYWNQDSSTDKGDLKEVDNPDGTSEAFDYDAYHDLTHTTDERQEPTAFDFDAEGDLTTLTDARADTTVTTYYPDGDPDAGLVHEVTDARHHTTTYLYDEHRRLWVTIDPLGDRTTYTYDAAGNVQEVEDALGHKTRTVYDGRNLLRLTVDAAQGETAQAYTASGLLAEVTDPLGHVTRSEYDQRGLKTRTVAADGTPAERWTEMAYNDAGQLLTTTTGLAPDTAPPGYAHPASTRYAYDALGRTTATYLGWQPGAAADDYARGTTLTYDAAGNVRWLTTGLSTTQEARPLVSRYGYDLRDRRAQVIEAVDQDDLRRCTTTVYDPDGNVQSVTDPRGDVTSYAYDALNRPTQVTRGFGTAEASTTTQDYDPTGNLLWVHTGQSDAGLGDYAHEAFTVYGYDELNRRTTTIEGYGDDLQRTTTDRYDAVGNLLSESRPQGYDADADAVRVITSYAYDELNRRTAVIEAYGVNGLRRTTAYGYDAAGNLLWEDHPQTYDTDANGDPTLDPVRVVTRYAYDELNRRTAVTEAAGTNLERSTVTSYDAADNVVAVVNPRGARTEYGYDVLNQQTTVIEAVGEPALQRTTTLAYDAAGNVVAVSKPLGYDLDAAGHRNPDPPHVRTVYAYDRLNRRTAVTEAAGVEGLQRSTYTRYDPADNVTAVDRPQTYDDAAEPIRIVTTYAYDALNRPTTLTEAYAHGTRLRDTVTTYDAADNVTSVRDPLDHAVTYTYDVFNRRTQAEDARGGWTTYAYDAADNLVALTDPEHNRTTFGYDALDRQTSRVDAFGLTVTYDYDAADNLRVSTDRLGRRREADFDLLDRKQAERWVSAAGAVDDRLTYTYDAADDLTTAANHAGTYTLTYDLLNRATATQDPLGLTVATTLDAADRPVRQEDSLGGLTASVYDDLGRLRSRSFVGQGTQARLDLTYNADDTLATAERFADVAGTQPVGGSEYGDDAGRVTAIRHRDGNGVWFASYSYAYDAADRLQSETDNGVTTEYTYDDTNQLTGDGPRGHSYDLAGNRTDAGYQPGAGNRLESDGVWDYTYDAEGNLAGKTRVGGGESWAYGYDEANHLLWAEQRGGPDGEVEQRLDFTNDVFGNRVGRQARSAAGGTTETRYAVDPQSGNVWADLDGSNALQTRRLYQDGVDQLFARVGADGEAAWYLTDHLGSVRDLTDGAGMPRDRIDYDAFGNVLAESDPGYGDRYKFTGREWDAALGLQHHWGREYDPRPARWTSEDPLGFGAGDPNLYRYVGNHPTTATDPSGLEEDPFDRVRKALRPAGSAPPPAWAGLRASTGLSHRPTCMSCHGGLTAGLVRFEDLSPAAQMDALRWVNGNYGPIGQAGLGAVAAGKGTVNAFATSWRDGPADPDARFWWGVKQTVVAIGNIPSAVKQAYNTLTENPGYAIGYGTEKLAEFWLTTKIAAELVDAPTTGRAPLLGGSAQRQAYIEALQAEGAQNYQFIRASGQQYSERSCVPGVLRQRLGSSPEMNRMVELADRQGGYTLEQAREFLANNELVPRANMRLVDSMSMQDLATRAAQANGRTTTVLNVRGTSGPHAVGVQGWTAVEGVPGGAFRIHDPLTGTEYWLSARSLQQRMTGPRLGSALLID